VSSFDERVIDSATKVSAGSGDEDLLDGFIPLSMACILWRVAFHTDVCFK